MIENLLLTQNVNPLWVKLDGDTRWKARWNFSIPITSFLYLSPMLKGETSERKKQIADIFSLDKSYKLAFHVLDTFHRFSHQCWKYISTSKGKISLGGPGREWKLQLNCLLECCIGHVVVSWNCCCGVGWVTIYTSGGKTSIAPVGTNSHWWHISNNSDMTDCPKMFFVFFWKPCEKWAKMIKFLPSALYE